ncbi:aminotransferase class I/II-fold pyridoxal phosphate-dependent enzyme [Streptomyces sp. NPDC005438]|uniref:aminotransferase class I/II-fold pyridoxal phosphate-dependent enzyme n=1 Tax=Streptomyces sp. NPDC005438 TaxID=3156880 RepID=UPI0033AB7734
MPEPKPGYVHDRVATAACGYWRRRGLTTAPHQVVCAAGAPGLLLALLAAPGTGGRGDGPTGSVLLPCPSAAWYHPPIRLLGRRPELCPIPADFGGVPDPVALRQTVRRQRRAGDTPTVLLLSVADDPTGTAVPPEALREVCEVAADEGLLVVSDETWRDTRHDPRGTVIVSPAEILHGHSEAVVLVDLGAALLSPPRHAAVARFPDHPRGRELARRVRELLERMQSLPTPETGAACAVALIETTPMLAERERGARLHGALARALRQTLVDAGALCRPAQLGRHLYPDFEPLRHRLRARHVEDGDQLAGALAQRLPAGDRYVAAGELFGEDPARLRVRLSTSLLCSGVFPGVAVDGAPGAGTTSSAHSGVREDTSADPMEWPEVAQALHLVRSTLTALTGGNPSR